MLFSRLLEKGTYFPVTGCFTHAIVRATVGATVGPIGRAANRCAVLTIAARIRRIIVRRLGSQERHAKQNIKIYTLYSNSDETIHIKVTIRPGFSGKVPIFNYVSRKKQLFWDAHLSRFRLGVPDLSRH